jgi:hypothetical protein
MRESVSVWLGSALLLLTSCGKGPTNTNAADWNAYVQGYLDAYFAAHDYAVAEGRHEFDGKLPDFSSQGLAREIARLHAARQQVLAFADTALDQRQRFERDYLISVIDGDLFWRESPRRPTATPVLQRCD